MSKARKKTAAKVASIGGLARAKSLTPQDRTEIAQKAARARWKGHQPSKPAKPRVGSRMPLPKSKQLHDLQVTAEAILDQLFKDPDPAELNKIQIEFFALRTQLDTLLMTMLDPAHHAIYELRMSLTIPTGDVMLRVLGILQGCLADVESGVLKA